MSDGLTPGESEATGAETVTFSHFGQEWTAPTQLRLSHRLALRRDPSNVGICLALMSEAELDRLLSTVDPTDAETDEFTDVMIAAAGLKDAGNS